MQIHSLIKSVDSHIYPLHKIVGFTSRFDIFELAKPNLFTFSICSTRRCEKNLRSLLMQTDSGSLIIHSYLTSAGMQRNCGCYLETSLISMKTAIEKYVC